MLYFVLWHISLFCVSMNKQVFFFFKYPFSVASAYLNWTVFMHRVVYYGNRAMNVSFARESSSAFILHLMPNFIFHQDTF